MTAEAAVMASNESREALAQRLLEWEQRARDAEAERDAMEKRARAYEAGSAKLQSERDALAAALEGLREPSVQLAETVENRDDLPIHKWAIKCARLVNQVRKASQ